MRKKAEQVLVIGACRMDYLTRSDADYIAGGDNHGTLFTTPGGNGRNVSENLARLKDKVTFITTIGEDHMGLSLKTNLTAIGVDVFNIQTKFATGIYNLISDANGKKIAYVEDSRAIDNIKPKDFKIYDAIIANQKRIVLDGALPDKVIDHIFRTYADKEFYVDGVSVACAPKFKKHLKKIKLFKSNYQEAKALVGGNEDPETLAAHIIKLGAKQVVISHTEEPIVYAEAGEVSREPIMVRTNPVRQNGVGDALFAGVVHCLLRGMPLKQAVKFSLNVAYKTLGVDRAVDPHLADIL